MAKSEEVQQECPTVLEATVHSWGAKGLVPLVARTRSIYHPIGPMVYDCLKLVFIRSGSAIVFSEFGHQPVSVGDAVMIGPNVLFSAEPEEPVTLTAIYVDTDFALDQFFWQHSAVLHDRLDAQGFAEKVYSEP